MTSILMSKFTELDKQVKGTQSQVSIIKLSLERLESSNKQQEMLFAKIKDQELKSFEVDSKLQKLQKCQDRQDFNTPLLQKKLSEL